MFILRHSTRMAVVIVIVLMMQGTCANVASAQAVPVAPGKKITAISVAEKAATTVNPDRPAAAPHPTAPTPGASGTPDPEIAKAIREVSPAQIQQIIAKLVSFGT